MTTEQQQIARRLERRVLHFIRDHIRLPAEGPLLLAVSGGPDSLAQLHILATLRRRLGLELAAAYIDHGLRPPDEIEAERSFVDSQARALDVRFLSAKARAEAGPRRSPEDAARRGRYRALSALAAEAGARAVATGHTRTDQAETVLLRLLRSSGLRGLAAMAPESAWPVRVDGAPRLLRPLLALDREETVAYCRALGLTPRTDSENENPRYLRNRVRGEVLPLLRSLNPRVEQALTNLAAEAREFSGRSEGDVARPVWADDDDGHTRIQVGVPELRRLSRPQRLAQLRAALEVALPGRPAPARAHLLALEQLALGPRGRRLALPDGLQAWRAGDHLLIGDDGPASVSALGPDRPVPIPGALALPGWTVTSELVAEGRCVAPLDTWTVVLDAPAVAGLVVGERRPGDRIELVGMSGRKRLQDLFVDEGVPRWRRPGWPVFRTARGVAWVAGFRPARWAAAGIGPAVVLRVQAESDADAGSAPSHTSPAGAKKVL